MAGVAQTPNRVRVLGAKFRVAEDEQNIFAFPDLLVRFGNRVTLSDSPDGLPTNEEIAIRLALSTNRPFSPFASSILSVQQVDRSGPRDVFGPKLPFDGSFELESIDGRDAYVSDNVYVCSAAGDGVFGSAVETTVDFREQGPLRGRFPFSTMLSDPEPVDILLNLTLGITCLEPTSLDFSLIQAPGVELLNRLPDDVVIDGRSALYGAATAGGAIVFDKAGQVQATFDNLPDGARAFGAVGLTIGEGSQWLTVYHDQGISAGVIPGTLSDDPVALEALGIAPFGVSPKDVGSTTDGIFLFPEPDGLERAAFTLFDMGKALLLELGQDGLRVDERQTRPWFDNDANKFGDHRPVSIFVQPPGFDASTPMLASAVADDGSGAGSLHLVNLAGDVAVPTKITDFNLLDGPGQLRCIETGETAPKYLCGAAGFGGQFSFGGMTYWTWDGGDNVEFLLRILSGRAVGVDVRKVGDSIFFASTGNFNNTVAVHEFSLIGEIRSFEQTDQFAFDCQGQTSAVFLDDTDGSNMRIIVSCNGSGVIGAVDYVAGIGF
jgi:hypothetical protein